VFPQPIDKNDNKQLLVDIFVICRIFKVEVGGISRSLRLIALTEFMSSSCTLCFCDFQNNQVLSKSYPPQALASADNSYLDFDYPGYHKNLLQ